MWSLLKSAIGLAVFAMLAYSAFFVDLGDRPFASHIADIWRSPELQSKVELVRDGVRNRLEQRLVAVAEEQTRRGVRTTLGGLPEIDDVDKEALERVLAERDRDY